MKQKQKIIVNFLFNFSVLIFFSLIVFLMGELTVRLFLPQPLENPINFYVADDLLGWKLKPDLHQWYINPEFKMEVISNERGFRDSSHTLQKNKDTIRILGLGDSMLFGYGVNINEGILSRMQVALQKNASLNKKIETINMGIPGYNINQYEKALRNEGYKFHPDLAILFLYNNDWKEDSSFDCKGVSNDGFLITGDKFSFKSARSFLVPLRVFLKRHSQLYILIRGRMDAVLKRKKLMALPEIQVYKNNVNFDVTYFHTLELINSMSKFCKQNINCRFLVCLIPEKFQVDDTYLNLIIAAYGIKKEEYDWLQPQKALEKFCRENDISYLDLWPTIRKIYYQGKLYFDIDPHLNSQGYSVASEEICSFIEKARLLKEK